jgi:hypothetical protein
MCAERRIQAAVLVLTVAIAGTALTHDLPAAEKTTGQGGLTPGEFEKLYKDLQPPRDELWRSIPWQASILEGRQLAAREKKPIFVWVASGEPLGCG